MRFEVTYSRTFTRTIDALDLAEAGRKMAAFRGSFPDGEIKIISIVDPLKKPGLDDDAVLRGEHKNGIDGVPI